MAPIEINCFVHKLYLLYHIHNIPTQAKCKLLLHSLLCEKFHSHIHFIILDDSKQD